MSHNFIAAADSAVVLLELNVRWVKPQPTHKQFNSANLLKIY